MRNNLQIQSQNQTQNSLLCSQSNVASASNDVATITNTHSKPTQMLKRIGSTTYVVSVHQSKVSKETAKDKIERLIQREAGGQAA